MIDFSDRITELPDKENAVQVIYLDFIKVFNSVFHKI